MWLFKAVSYIKYKNGLLKINMQNHSPVFAGEIAKVSIKLSKSKCKVSQDRLSYASVTNNPKFSVA